MTPAPSLQDVIHLVEVDAPEEQPLSRLRTASTLVQGLAEVGDAALGYFVDQARHAGHSWSEIGEALGVSKQAAQQKQSVRLSLNLNASFERFTPRARNVVSAAEPIAREWGHSHVGSEHLLLALYREPEGVAAQILLEAGLPADQAGAAIGARIERGPGPPEEKLSFTPRATAVFTGALTSALELGHNYVGTEHLLLGLARGDGPAMQVLAGAGLSQEALEGKVTEKIAAYTQARQPGPSPGPTAPTGGRAAQPAPSTRARRAKT